MKKSRFILSMLVLPMVALAQLESDALGQKLGVV